MTNAGFLHRSLLTVCFTLIATYVFAQAEPTGKAYVPTVGQEGKDVIWVPTAQALADKMLDLAKVTPQDYVIDLGSGDGRLVITAAKRGARALGVEYNPDMVLLSRRNAEKEGVSDKAQFLKADLFETDFSQASVITMFLLPTINMKLRPKILNLKPGTRIVSNSFTMGDWEADETVAVSVHEGCDNTFCEAYFWVVPAKAEGTWQLPQGELVVKQSYQKITGALTSGNDSTPVTNGRLRGDEIIFTIGDAQYTGRVKEDSMAGTVTAGGKTTDWNATRVGRFARCQPHHLVSPVVFVTIAGPWCPGNS